MSHQLARRVGSKKRTGTPGDWMKAKGRKSAASETVSFDVTNYDEVYESLEGQKQSALSEIMESVSKGKAVIEDAILFCGRYDENGMLLREAGKRKKPYRLLRTKGHAEFEEASNFAREQFEQIAESTREAREAAADERAKRRSIEAARKRVSKKARENWPFQSSSDAGSTYSLDPNQFTEYTPYYSGPWGKQQYFDYFKGHARAYQEYTHHPIGKRLIDILIQYGFGRGFKIQCKNQKFSDKWNDFNRQKRITHKLRKYWMREYLIYGENFIDVLRWVSVDPSTIIDIICEGYDEYIDKVLYYQQMFQTATQMYSGQKVKGVKGSADSKIGKYIIRQIPYDQIIHIKTNVVSVEKRGRSVLYPILGWLKRVTDTLDAQILGEQLRASFVWDDTVDGDQSDVDAHAAKYNYIPVQPSLFVHNTAVKREALAPMSGVTGNGSGNIVQEVIAICATCLGLPKDHLNVMAVGSGSRATAVVGSEPFTKVIEDLQEDGKDLLDQIIQIFCQQNNIEYDEEDWAIIFPSVQKDALNDRLKAIWTLQASGAYSHKRASLKSAAEMEDDDYDYDAEMEEIEAERAKGIGQSSPPAPWTNAPPVPTDDPDPAGGSPIHGKGKQDIISQHKTL